MKEGKKKEGREGGRKEGRKREECKKMGEGREIRSYLTFCTYTEHVLKPCENVKLVVFKQNWTYSLGPVQ